MVKLSELTKDYYWPGEVAKMLHVHVRTIQRHMNEGTLDYRTASSGRRLVKKESVIRLLEQSGVLADDSSDLRKDAVYARVSTRRQKNRGDLERQIEAVCAFAAMRNPQNLTVYSDVASGLNDNRKGLNTLLDEVMNGRIGRIFVRYKDRLTRFGFNYLKRICEFHQTEIIIVSSEEENRTMEEELAEDIISIVHSFSGKLCGMRKTVRTKVDQELSKEVPARAKEDSHAKTEPQEQKVQCAIHHPD